MHKFLIVGMLLLAYVPGLLAEDNRFAEAPPKERATWHLAVHAAARRTLEAAASMPLADAELPEELRDKLTTDMLAAIAAHAQRTDSEPRCRAIMHTFLQTGLTNQMQQIVAVANAQTTLPVSIADIEQIAGPQIEQAHAQARAAFETQHWETIFTQARSDAVALERQKIDAQVAPPPFAVVDDLLTKLAERARGPLPAAWSGKHLQHLHKALSSYAGGADAPMLEEIATYADGLAKRMIEGIRLQYAHQLTQVESFLHAEQASGIRLAKALETYVLERIDATRSAGPEMDNASGVPLPNYPVFSLVRQAILQQAQDLERKRFSAFLEKTPILEISPDELRELIQADLKAHRKSPDSHKLLQAALMLDRQPRLVKTYVGTSDDAQASAHFTRLLQEASPPATVVQQRLEDGLRRQVPEVRQALASAQYTASGFAALEDVEILPDALLEIVHQTRGAPYPTLDAALAFLVQGDIQIEKGTVARNQILEETATLALDRVHMLVAAADATIQGQLALLRELETASLPQLQRDITEGLSLEQILPQWEDTLLQRWRKQAAATGSPYTTLTPPTRDLLNKTVRQLYNSVREEQEQEAQREQQEQADRETVTPPPAAADAVMSEKPPEVEETTIPPPAATEEATASQAAGAGGGASSGEQSDGAAKRPLPDVLLLLAGDNTDRCRATLLLGLDNKQRTQVLDVTDPAAAAEVLFSMLEPDLAALRTQAIVRAREGRGWFGFLRAADEPAVSVHVVVDSNAVRHRMSLLLKQRIEEALNPAPESGQDATPSVAVDWQAGLTYDAPLPSQPPPSP